MKDINKTLLMLVLASITFSCTKDESQTEEGSIVEELTFELKVDPDFNAIISKNSNFSSLFLEKIEKIRLTKEYSSIEDVNIHDLMTELGINDSYNKHIEDVNNHFVNIRDKYPNLNLLSEYELKSVYDELSSDSIIISNSLLRRPANCDDQFQSDMQTIHDQYDTAVAMCTVATLVSGGLAAPCFVFAVANTVFQTSVAIDRHTICTQNQEQ
tara:strand:+ start:496 stop:1134 length:639 start_codon:yes stop_codon:yes gene_type:complete